MKNNCIFFPLTAALLLLSASWSAAAATTTTAPKIILAPDNYIVINGLNASFKAQAKFGTPCFSPPYYTYEWYLDADLIGTGDEMSKNSMDFSPGKYTLTLKVTDCVGRTTTDSKDINIVNPLSAKISSIETGGSTVVESMCVISACKVEACNPQGWANATDSYGAGRTYRYNRSSSAAGNLFYLTYDGSLSYEITDPNVAVLFPNKCVNANPYSFFTLAFERSTEEYYLLIGEDDFIGGLENVPQPFCKNVCNAFMTDFIPIVSDIVLCGATEISPPQRFGSTAAGYTEVVVSGQNGKKMHYIFADDMSSFLEGRWQYKRLEVGSGTSYISISDFCTVVQQANYPLEKCLLSFKGTAAGGLPPYTVKWVSSDDGVIDEYKIAVDGGEYNLQTTPPLVPPLSEGLHDITFNVEDQLGLKAEDTWSDAKIPWCCAVKTPCKKYWPGRDGPQVNTGNEMSYSCDIYEVCRPELWQKAREAIYCCKNGCPSGCHENCKDAYDAGAELGAPSGILNADGLKKCAGLYLIYGFGPAEKYMTDYYWPELCCTNNPLCLSGGDEGCCKQDMGTCTCAWHAYSREAQAILCQSYVSTSPRGWASNVAMNKNTCMFSDLPAYANMDLLHTGTCCDYANSVLTMLRIVGYGPDEAYMVAGPMHCYNMVKFPQSPNWNIIDTTNNKKVPYEEFGLPGGNYPYCSYTDCRNDAGMAGCPTNVWGC